MLNFIKYEWLRRWKFFLAGILTFIVVNVDLLMRIMQKEGPNFISMILMMLLFGLGAALVLDHMGRVYRILFTDESLTELTLPLSGYKLLGAKLICVVLECIAVMFIVGLAAYIDVRYLDMIYFSWQMTQITWEIFFQMLQVAGLVLGGYITFILMIYLSLALAKSFFAPFKYGKLIAFGCFIALGKVTEVIGNLININGRYSLGGPVFIVAINDWLVMAVMVGVLFTATAYILDRKVNL